MQWVCNSMAISERVHTTGLCDQDNGRSDVTKKVIRVTADLGRQRHLQDFGNYEPATHLGYVMAVKIPIAVGGNQTRHSHKPLVHDKYFSKQKTNISK